MLIQGTHCTQKTGKMTPKKSLSEKTLEISEVLPNHGIWFAQVVNTLILKVTDFSIFASKISKFLLKLDKSAKSVLCM